MQDKMRNFMLAMDSLLEDNKYRDAYNRIIDERLIDNLRHDSLDILRDAFGPEILDYVDVIVEEDHTKRHTVNISFINKETGNILSEETNEFEAILSKIM